MEVISTEKRGPQTIYTVREGERVWKLTRDELPPDVFHRWRNHQAALCMRRKRAQAKETNSSINHGEQAGPATSEQQNQPPPSETGAPERTKSPTGPSDAAISALNMMTCKICKENKVQRLIVPCGHLVLCSDCLTKVMATKKQCPFCRKEVKDHFGVIMIE